MRIIVTLLFAALLVFSVWSFVDSQTFLLGPQPELPAATGRRPSAR